MRASARLRVEAPCRLVELVSDPPLTLRPDSTGTVWLVASAAGPMGGDDLNLRIEVAEGARVTVHSAAAQLVLPGTTDAPARLTIEVHLAEGAHLTWSPEPTVIATGATLHQRTSVDMTETANLTWRETVVLGRHDEPAGHLTSALRVDRAGQPLLRHTLKVPTPAWQGPAGLAGARAIAAELRAGREAAPVQTVPGSCRGDAAVVLPLDGNGALAMAASPAAREAIARLDWLTNRVFTATS